MFLRYRTFRPRLGLLPRVLLAAGIAAVLILATVGAVIGLGLLAVGALVHTIVRQIKGQPVGSVSHGASSNGAVIDGEFVVVSDAARARPPLPPAADSLPR